MTLETFNKRMRIVIGILAVAVVLVLVNIFSAGSPILTLVTIVLDVVAFSIMIPTINKRRKDPRP